jgi:hypothetical protein
MQEPCIALSPDTVVLDQLRARWLAAIFDAGPLAARDDAVVAFIERMHCSRAEAEEIVDKAWCRLELTVHASCDGSAHGPDPAVVQTLSPGSGAQTAWHGAFFARPRAVLTRLRDALSPPPHRRGAPWIGRMGIGQTVEQAHTK